MSQLAISSSILHSIVDFTHLQLCAKFQHPWFTNKGVNVGGGEKHPTPTQTYMLTEDPSPNRINGMVINHNSLNLVIIPYLDEQYFNCKNEE